ncbi:MAG TPA: RidA family protein [Sphaerochaeta sp.]|jgi:2-iminobutanoate/2-iminopropanoate deaminase|nr:RidA family protein [Spirochaetota bacterium]NLV60341.1 RidA family protein [Spirochaetales bacterium]HOE84152.1 RidA family protein [Sphaerochaeta sp.]HOQ94165.1 RidA family protein [Sphaerochaeta sp.]HPK46903.1 RidA family protein [Sphaerochaeta sp.]
MIFQLKKSVVATEAAPKAIGPYSQAVAAGPFVFTSGTLPLDPESGQIVGSNATEQTRQVFENLQAVLAAAGTDLSKAVKVTVFLKDMADFAAMNEVYASYIGDGVLPSRSAVQVARLPKDALVEIEMIVLA